jgi:hypothetical protein
MDTILMLSEEFLESVKDLKELTENDDKDMLHAGMHFMSIYEQLMLAVEKDMHPDYQKNIKEFRKRNNL